MCGFVVIVSRNGSGIISPKVVKAMMDTMHHRGPDDEGAVFCQGNTSKSFGNRKDDLEFNLYTYRDQIEYSVVLGFRRLAIIDLTVTGHQPMQYHNRYWIVFNGEIYNYYEIREELNSEGYRFYSSSDTEVIMAAYDKWGKDCLNRFNGMWAFVIYDSYEQQIFISRDRFGIKPLYIYQDEKQFILASEIKCILQHPSVSNAVNLIECQRFLVDGEDVSHNETIFKNVRRFERASYAILNKGQNNNKLDLHKFWQPKMETSRRSPQDFEWHELQAEYLQLLESSVRYRMIADVKVGSALSGGIDSSSIVYFIAKNLGYDTKQFETFSNVYPDARFKEIDESHYIKTLSDYFQIKSNRTSPVSKNIPEEYTKMINITGSPTNSSNMSGWYTYKLTHKQGVTVTLDGQGADELAAGYPSYLFHYLLDVPFDRLFNERRLIVNNYSSNVPSILKVLGGKILRAMPEVPGKILREKFKIKMDMDSTLNEILKYDMTVNLANLLYYGDALSMAHSVESRVPYLDYRLVEFFYRLPASFKIHKGWTKYINRIAMQDKLPGSIVWRKDKIGWPNADDYWFFQLHANWTQHMINNSKLLSELSDFKLNDRNLDLAYKMRLLSIAVWENLNNY